MTTPTSSKPQLTNRKRSVAHATVITRSSYKSDLQAKKPRVKKEMSRGKRGKENRAKNKTNRLKPRKRNQL